MNINNIKLVTDGKSWAIKRGWIFYKYYCIDENNWYKKFSKGFWWCWTPEKEEAEECFKRFKS